MTNRVVFCHNNSFFPSIFFSNCLLHFSRLIFNRKKGRPEITANIGRKKREEFSLPFFPKWFLLLLSQIDRFIGLFALLLLRSPFGKRRTWKSFRFSSAQRLVKKKERREEEEGEISNLAVYFPSSSSFTYTRRKEPLSQLRPRWRSNANAC